MGTWNAKPFGNDTAADWLLTLEKADGASVLKSALVKISRGKRLKSAEACEEAVAAAAVICAARHNPVTKLPKAALRWIAESGFVPSATLVAQAIHAVKAIAHKSSLRELWDESPSAAKWMAEMHQLLAALCTARPTLNRKRRPKPPTGRLSLPKLIERVNPDGESALREALRRKLDTLKDLNGRVAGTWERTALHLLAARGMVPEARRLLDRGANIAPQSQRDWTVSTPLEEACLRGRTEMVEVLLERGAPVHREIFVGKDGVPMPRDPGGGGARIHRIPRALYSAVESGNVATVEVLLRHGADLRHLSPINGQTLLHHAADVDHPGMIRFLVQRGLSLEAKEEWALTPLLWAVMNFRKKSVATLLALGANPNAKDNEGATALDLATGHKDLREIARLIRKRGGRAGDGN